MKTRKRIMAVAMVSLALFGSGAGYAGDLRLAGCEGSEQTVMRSLGDMYHAAYGTEVVLEQGHQSDSITTVDSGAADLGCTSWAQSDSQSSPRGVILKPVAWDAVAIAVNPQNPVQTISFAQLSDILSGRLTNWKELGGPDSPIRMLDLADGGNQMRTMVEDLLPGTREAAAPAEGFADLESLQQALEQDPDGMALLAWTSARKRAVKILRLEGVEPDYTAIKSGNYLLYHPVYLAYDQRSSRRDESKRLVEMAHSAQGRELFKTVGLVPYLDGADLRGKQRGHRKLIDTLVSGSGFPETGNQAAAGR